MAQVSQYLDVKLPSIILSSDPSTELSSAMYMRLNGVTQDDSSTDPKMAYQHLKINNTNNYTTNETNIKRSHSDTYLGPTQKYSGCYLVPNKTTGNITEYKNVTNNMKATYLGPTQKYSGGYLVPNKTMGNLPAYKNETENMKTVGLRNANVYKNMPGDTRYDDPLNNGVHKYITVLEDKKPENGSMKALSVTNIAKTSQHRMLPELPVRSGQDYEELSQPEEGDRTKLCRCWTCRRLVILISSLFGAACVIVAIALIAYYTTHGNTSSAPSVPAVSPDPIAVVSACNNGTTQSGVYTLGSNSSGFNVYCDMQTDGGGWLVFLRRQDGSQDFYRSWAQYKKGFGSLVGEFWLGNDYLHQLTSATSPCRLRVDLESFDGTKVYAQYENFRIASEDHKYNITFNGFSGTAGDSLNWHYGLQFTTLDSDNDLQPDYNCAVAHQGAWWYNACYQSNLNGKYFQTSSINDKGDIWRQLSLYSLKFAEMKIKLLS